MYKCEGIFDLYLYVIVTSPYPWDRASQAGIGAQALTPTIQPNSKLMGCQFAIGMHESRLYNPTTIYKVYLFLPDIPSVDS